MLVLLALLALAAVPTRGAATEGALWVILVGVDDYDSPAISDLRFAVADARRLAATLSLAVPPDHLFLLTSDGQDRARATRANVEWRVDWLTRVVQPGDTVLFFFSGHGLEFEGGGAGFGRATHLLTADADPSSIEAIRRSTLPTARLNETLSALEARNLLMVIDACRNDPVNPSSEGSRSAPVLTERMARDLVMTEARDLQISPAGPTGSPNRLTLYGCRPGERSYEWAEKGHGFFTFHLVEGLRGAAADSKGLITLAGLMEYLQDEVPAATQRAYGVTQTPFVLGEGSMAMAVVELPIIGGQPIPVPSPPPPVTHAPAAAPEPIPPGTGSLVNSRDGSVLLLVPGGPFRMGSTAEEVDQTLGEAAGFPRSRLERETPAHEVQEPDFYIGRTEVTVEQFRAFAETPPGYQTVVETRGWSTVWRNGRWEKVEGADWRHPQGPGSAADPTTPVVHVTHEDALAYCEWAGLELPGESQWEKAARGTDGRPWPWGGFWDPARAVMAAAGPAPAGSRPAGASPCGALDMAGNAREWTATPVAAYPGGPRVDAEPGSLVVRGGSWRETEPVQLRAAYRAWLEPDYTNDCIGFRVARRP